MSPRVIFDITQQPNKRSNDVAPVEIRADVTTTVYLGPTGGVSSSSGGTSNGVPVVAIIGGLAAGVILVLVAASIWWCCTRGSRNRARNEREHRLPAAQGKFGRIEWRAEDTFSLPQKKGAFPPSPTTPSSPHTPSSSATLVNLPLRSSSASRSSSSDEWVQGSGDTKYDEEAADYVGPDDLGYGTSALAYDHPSSTSSDEGSRNNSKESSDGDGLEPLPSPRSARKSRRRSMSKQRREPPPPPPSASTVSPGGTSGARRYAPARPSPLTQISYRNSALSPAPSPIPPPVPAHIPIPEVQSPTSPFADPADPFLDDSRQYHQYYREDEGGRPVSGVGYAI